LTITSGALIAFHERRHRYRTVFEDLLLEGANQGRMSFSNAKITAFAIIEMAEGVPRWFSPTGEVSINQLVFRRRARACASPQKTGAARPPFVHVPVHPR
jgi:TRAP-type C4-dicarboxylate transport system permease small subunit